MRSRLRNRNRFGFVAFTAVLVLLVVFGTMFSRPIFNIISALATSFSVEVVEEYTVLSKKVLAARLYDAERELGNVRYQAALYASLVEENQRLLDELGLRTPAESGIGRVIQRPPHTHYDTLLVSLKNGHAVSVGDIALFEGIALGTVEKISGSAALVSLFSSPGRTLDVRVGDPTAIVVAHGLGGGAFVFDVPNEVSLEEGDVMVSASHDTEIIGVVLSITTDPDRTTKRVHARTAASLTDVRFVHFVAPITISREDL